MGNEVATCDRCGKTITPEEIEVGESLTCPVCEDDGKKKQKADKDKQKAEK